MANIYEMIADAVAKARPDIANSDFGKKALDVIRSGDAKQGAEFAENIHKSYGLSREEATSQASNGLMNIFGRK